MYKVHEYWIKSFKCMVDYVFLSYWKELEKWLLGRLALWIKVPSFLITGKNTRFIDIPSCNSTIFTQGTKFCKTQYDSFESSTFPTRDLFLKEKEEKFFPFAPYWQGK